MTQPIDEQQGVFIRRRETSQMEPAPAAFRGEIRGLSESTWVEGTTRIATRPSTVNFVRP